MDYLLAKAPAAALQSLLAPFHAVERLYWLYLLTSLVLAFLVWRRRRLRAGEATPATARGFLGFVFPGAIYKHASARTDFLYFVVNRAFYGVLVVPWCVETDEVRRVTSEWLDAWLPWGQLAMPPGILKDVAFTLVAATALDLGVYVGHWLTHRVPFLWEFHKVHHSAEVLTPITLYRSHPIDDIVSISISATIGGLVQGGFVHFLGGGPQWFTIRGVNFLLLAFYVFGYNLRHSHVWLSYGTRVERWLLSPAQHQLHHSTAPEHFDKNFGFTFAIWDRLAGTLVTTTPAPRALTLGTGSGTDAAYHSLAALYLKPFREVAARSSSVFKVSGAPRAVLFGTMVVVFGLQVAIQLPGPQHLGTVRLEDLTWVEVRDRIARGQTTALVPIGGTEQGGPHLTLGKHNLIVAWTSDAIARELGDAVVAPVIPVSPAGAIEPPTGHMTKAGTLSLSEPVFESLVEETARSLAAHGFRAICLLGDHGSSQPGLARVAERLTREWRSRGIRVIHVADYYSEKNGQWQSLLDEGEKPGAIGGHAGIRDTSELLVVEPRAVRLSEERDRGGDGFATSGVDGDPTRATPERGRRLLALKVSAAVRQIRTALATPVGLEPLSADMATPAITTAPAPTSPTVAPVGSD